MDGSIHHQPDVASEDARITERLEDRGYTMIRFSYKGDWLATCAAHAYVFGAASH
jgi:hypothetical protein